MLPIPLAWIHQRVTEYGCYGLEGEARDDLQGDQAGQQRDQQGDEGIEYQKVRRQAHFQLAIPMGFERGVPDPEEQPEQWLAGLTG